MIASHPSQTLGLRHDRFIGMRSALRNAPPPSLEEQCDWRRFWPYVSAALEEAGYMEATRLQFRHVLRALYLHGFKRPIDISAPGLEGFIRKLAATECSWSWQALHITTCRTIFDVLCNFDLTRHLHVPKRPQPLPEILSRDEAERLVLSGRCVRDQLLLGLLYGCGLSGLEASALCWGDVRKDGRGIHVAESTRYRERWLSVPEALVGLLKAGVEGCTPSQPVFPGRHAAAALTTRSIGYIVRRARDDAQIPKMVSTLALRHSYAVHRLEQGINLRQVQEELGHASVATTERYLRCIPPEIKVSLLAEIWRRQGREEPVHAMPEQARYAPLEGLACVDLSGLVLPLLGDMAPSPFARLMKTRFFSVFRS